MGTTINVRREVRARRVHYLIGIVTAWWVGGLLLAFFERALWDRLWVFTVGLRIGYALLGAAIWLAILWSLRQAPRPRSAVTLAVGMPLAVLALWLAEPYLSRAGDEFLFSRRFAMLRSEYDVVVAKIRESDAAPIAAHTWITERGIRFQIDSGPPVRVAFLQPGGILDNWEGVIYDPTARVATATGWRDNVAGNYTAAADVVGVFGGALLACEPLEGAYYRCWFT